MSQAQLSNEAKYKMTVSFLKKLLLKGVVTQKEYEVADRLNAERFQPVFISI
jgi:hypothetical protein